MTQSATIGYFGRAKVEEAVANYFAQHGLNEDVRDNLMEMVINSEDDFFQMVCDFIEKNG